jgi:dihydrofolate reductase
MLYRGFAMRKLIYTINLTLDGFIDHTAVIADDELHEKAASLFSRVDIVLYGRIAYQLLAEYWPTAPSDKSLSKSVREFAESINKINKIVFSRTMKSASWNTRIFREVDPKEIIAMKQLPGKDILLGGGARIAQKFMELDLIDEYCLIMQPVLLGKGKPIINNLEKQKDLLLIGHNEYKSGVIELIYKPREKTISSQ